MLPDRARQLQMAAVAVATSAAGRAPPFARGAHSAATKLHIYPNINVARRDVAKSTRISPSSPSSSSSSSSPSALRIATGGGLENPHTRGDVPPGPAFKRRRAASYPMYSKPPRRTERVGGEPLPSHAPPRTPTRHRMTETERPFKLLSGSDGRTPLAGIHALAADVHGDTGAAGYRPPRGIPPPVPAFNERNVGGVAVSVDDRRRGGQPAGIQAVGAGTDSNTGAVDYRPHGFPPPAHLINDRDFTGVSALGSKRCGKQPVHPNERASGRFAIGTAVRAGRGVKADPDSDPDPPLSSTKTSGKEVNERAGGGLRSPPPSLESTMARTTGAAGLR